MARKHQLQLLTPSQRHLVTRFGYGVDAALAQDVVRAGGAQAWFERQLTRPGSFPDAAADSVRRWWPDLDRKPSDLWQRQIQEVRGGWEVMADYGRWLLVRRIRTRRPVLEKMTEFWEAMLHVPASGDAQFTWRVDYGDTIRAHALGRFDELLVATTTHPAMLIFLSAATSTKTAPNENLGRELLELHTVGLGSYDENHVKDSARILTGWRVDTQQGNRTPTWNAAYTPSDHALGPVQVMDFADANDQPDGRDLTRRYISYLAHHPLTARRIAIKLVWKFVRDDASPALVDRLAQVYLANDTAIAPVLRALIDSPEFNAATGTKVRDATEEVVATWRVLGVQVRRPTGPDSAANTVLWQADNLGLMPFMWPRPDGAPLVNAPWCTPSRMIASFDMHHSMTGGYWPSKAQGMVYRNLKTWVPQAGKAGIRLDELVDHLSQQLLHQHATPVLVKAACRAVGYDPDEMITTMHPVRFYGIASLLTTVLDSPDYFQR